MERSRVYIAGAPGGGSIAPPAHDFIARCLNREWTMSFLEASTIQEVVDVCRAADFAGAIVTMPHKTSIIPHLDEADDMVFQLGACNHVSITEHGGLRGTNTDWIGIKNALIQAAPPSVGRTGRKGLVVGAGGACRAAVYALSRELGCGNIYVVNRDAGEVKALAQDVQRYDSQHRPNIIHVQTVQDAKGLPNLDYIVSTVPDFEAVTPEEMEARNVFIEVLRENRNGKAGQGVVLDMCYHPLMTQNLRLAQQHGWQIVQGVEVVGHQLREQWRLWTGEEITQTQEETAWRIMRESAESDVTVTGVGKV